MKRFVFLMLFFIGAALESRIDLCVPAVPLLPDVKDFFKIAVWPGGELANYFKEHFHVNQ